MELPVNAFKAALVERRRVFGTWLMMDNPVTAEAMSYVGFDFLVVDMEHSGTDIREARAQLQAIEGGNAASVVRLPATEATVTKKVLDIGAQSLMFPMIQSVEDAKRAVSYTRYAPEGIRGMAAMHRASRYTTVDGYLEKAVREICVTVQIETKAGVENAAAIASVPGVDGLFVGPGDLSASLGVIGQVTHASVIENIERVLEDAHRAGKPAGILAANEELGDRYAKMGFDFVAIASDLAFLMKGARGALARVKG